MVQATRGGEQPLMAAAKGGNPEAVELLLAEGADLWAQDARGRDALMLACRRNKVKSLSFPAGEWSPMDTIHVATRHITAQA